MSTEIKTKSKVESVALIAFVVGVISIFAGLVMVFSKTDLRSSLEKPKSTVDWCGMYVRFEDENLETAIRSLDGVPDGDEPICDYHVQDIRSLELHSLGIESLKGLEHFRGLVEINLSNNNITDIEPLIGLVNLKNLYLGYNRISDIRPIVRIENLEKLILDDNGLGDGNVSILMSHRNAGLFGLLSLSRNNIVSTDFLEPFTRLIDLNLSHNMISGISGINSSRLWGIDLSHNKIRDISHLGTLDLAPKGVILENNNIPINSESLEGRISLEIIGNLSRSAIVEYHPQREAFCDNGVDDNLNGLIDCDDPDCFDDPVCLEECDEIIFLDSNLEALVRQKESVPESGDICRHHVEEIWSLIKDSSVEGEEIVNLSGLEYFSNLTQLILPNQKISDLRPLSGLINLEQLILYSNEIEDLRPMAGLVNLKNINLSDNKIYDITPLERLDINPMRSGEAISLANNEISWFLLPSREVCGASVENYRVANENGWWIRFLDQRQRETICDDGCDNNGSGLIDCDDPDCFDDPVCR